MQITISSFTIPNWQHGGASATLRILANDTFINSSGQQVSRNYVRDQTFYQTVNCTVSGTTITVPQFTIDSTEDSSNRNATYTALLFDENGVRRGDFSSGFRVPSNFGSTVPWSSIYTHNQAVRSLLPYAYPNINEVMTLVTGGDAVEALTRTSADVVLQQNIDNEETARQNADTTLQNNITAEAVTRANADTALDNAKQDVLVNQNNIKSINNQSLLGAGNIQISGGAEELLSSYATLADALTAIGSTRTTLAIDQDVTITTPVTIPATLQLSQKNKSAITLSGIGAIDFAGRGIEGNESGLFVYSSIPSRVWPSYISVDASANTITSASHGLTTGQQMRLVKYKWGGGATVLPGNLSEGGLYYAIVTSSSVFKLATSYADALAGTAVDITDVGSGGNGFFFLATPVTWTGTDHPHEVFSDILSDGGSSISTVIQHLSNSFIGKGVTINVKPGTFTGTTLLLNDKHSIRLLQGTHQNTFAGSGGSLNFGPFNTCIVIGSDAEFTSEPGGIMMESSVNYYTATVHIRPGAENSSIHDVHFLAQGAAFDGLDATVRIDSGFNNHIFNNYFENCQAYVCSIVPGSNGDLPQYSSIRNNKIEGCLSQVLFIGGGEFCDIIENEVITRNLVQTSSFVFIDLEPNSDLNVIKDCRINRNRLDYRGVTNAGVLFGFINVNTADTSGFERIQISDNDFIANDVTGTQNSLIYGGVNVYGTDQFEVSNNRFHGIGTNGPAIGVYHCRRGRVMNNSAYNGSGKIDLVGTVECDVGFNKFFEVSSNGATQTASITEFTAGMYPIGSITGDTLTLSYSIFDGGTHRGTFYTFYETARCYINGNQYTVESVVPGTVLGDIYTDITMTATIAEPTAPIVLPYTDIDTGTDLFTAVSHGLNTGACVFYGAASPAGGLSDASDHWVIRNDADSFKLATSYENAIAGVAIDITSQGSGNHTFYLNVTMYSYSNKFYNNDNVDGITLAPLSTSVEISSPYSTTLAVDGDVTVEIDQAGIIYRNTSAALFTRMVLPTSGIEGKNFKFYVADDSGLQIIATNNKTIRDGTTVSDANNYIYSGTVGSALELTYIGGEWVVTSKNGTWAIHDFDSLTNLYRIDCGRTSGGSVGGWAQDTLFTGGTASSWAGGPFTWNQSAIPTPPTDAVYDTWRTSAFQYDFTGLSSGNAHVVRLHFGTNDASAGIGFYIFDIKINDVVYIHDLAIQTKLSDLVPYVVDLVVPSGVTAIKVECGTNNYLNGIELYQI